MEERHAFGGGDAYSAEGASTGQMESHEKCLEKGRNEIVKLINSLDFRESRESNETEALQLYRLALDKGFTKGRKITMVRK